MAGLFDKAREMADGEQGENISDQALKHGADFAGERTGGKHDEQIEQARKAADERIGRE